MPDAGNGDLRVVIVDDEALGRDTVRMALAHESRVRVVGECASGREAIEMLTNVETDVVFLDVQMPGGDGFHVVQSVGPDRMPVVVFVTAFDEHALRAFDVHAVDYLLKPFDQDRFRKALERARVQVSSHEALEKQHQLAALLRDVNGTTPPERYLTRITIRDEERAYFVRAADVDWFEGFGNYVKLHARGQEHRIRGSLRELTEQLDPIQFRRVHKSTIVNVDRIKEVQPWFGGDYVVILHDGSKLKVSRTYAVDLLQRFQ
jgi:two-component system, LytTR family, response regulator